MALVPLLPKAIERAWVGVPAAADAKALVTQTYSLSKEELSAIDHITGSGLTNYISHSDFVRHAVWELLRAYEEAGFPDDFLPDVTYHIHAMRDQARRLKIRQDFQDILLTYEASLSDGVETGDYDLIESALHDLEGYVDRTPDAHWQQYLRRVILRSAVVRMGVDALYEVSRAERQYAKAAGKWQVWLEGLHE